MSDTHQDVPRRPAPPIIEVMGEEHHAFPANRPGANAQTPNPNARTPEEPKTRMGAQEKLDASRAARSGNISESDRKIIEALPPGHPMRIKLQEHQTGVVHTTAKSKPMFSTRKPTRLDLERKRKGVDAQDVRTQAEADPNFQTIGLPSQFKFYDFQALTVSHMKGLHQAKLSRAAKDRKMRYVVEAISSTLGEGVSAFDLTPQDFYFLMYWHRLQSFPKNPQLIPYTCSDKEHVRRTILREDHPEHLSPETLDISSILNETTLKTVYLEDLDLSPFAELDAKYGLGVETMRDIVEFAELQEEEEYFPKDEPESEYGESLTTASVDVPSDESFDEVEWLQVRSVFLKRGPGRNTILERNEIVKQMSADEIFELDKYIEAVSAYGVSEAAVIRCKECSASHRVPLSVDALTFLP